VLGHDGRSARARRRSGRPGRRASSHQPIWGSQMPCSNFRSQATAGASGPVQPRSIAAHSAVRQPEGAGRHVLFQMGHGRGAGYGQDHRGDDGAATPGRSGRRSPGGALPPCPAGPPGPGELARRHRKPGDEAELVLLAVLQHVLVLAIAQVVQVLHADDRDRLLRARSISATETSERPIWWIFPACCRAFSAPRDSSTGTWGIEAVQLIEIDPVGLQPPQAQLHALLEIFRPAHRRPISGGRSGSARPWSR
jgi:hypothetical protein